jgi:hypothetical protein
VRTYVCKTLPWLAPREIRATQQMICGGQCDGARRKNGNFPTTAPIPANAVITISGDAGSPQAKYLRHVVKVTVDRRGSIVKMSISK